MGEVKDDILVEIPDEELPKLAALYEKHTSWAPHILSLVHMGMRWKKSEKYRDTIKFLSPKNSWANDGTIIVIIKPRAYDIIVFTLDDECLNLKQGLLESSLIEYKTNGRFLLYAVHEKHIPTVMDVIKKKNLNLVADIPCYIYAVAPDQAKSFAIECPPDVYIKKLDASSARQINRLWPHRFTDSENYLADFIEINGGYGVYLKSNDELVSWILKHNFGHLAMLQTEDKYKNRGYGSLVTKVLSKEMAEEGHWPLGTVLLNNRPSVGMFEKLGFRSIGTCTFIVLK